MYWENVFLYESPPNRWPWFLPPTLPGWMVGSVERFSEESPFGEDVERRTSPKTVGRSPRNSLLGQWSPMIVAATERRVTFDESVAILPTYWPTPNVRLYKKYYIVIAVDSPRSKGHSSIVGRVPRTAHTPTFTERYSAYISLDNSVKYSENSLRKVCYFAVEPTQIPDVVSRWAGH